MRHIALIAIAALFALPAGAAEDADRAALLEGVSRLVAPGSIPAPMVAAGPDAFVVAAARMGAARAPLFAAARYGKGRVLGGGHEGFFGRQNLAHPDNARLLTNAVRWLGGGKANVRVGLVGVPDLEPVLREAGCRVVPLREADIPARLSDVDVLCTTGHLFSGAGRSPAVEGLAGFVRKGGGLFLNACAWGWQQLTPNGDIRTEMGANRVCARMGLAWADAMVEAPGTYPVDQADLDLLHASRALDALAAGTPLTDAQSTQAGSTLSTALRALPPRDPFLGKHLDALIAARHEPAVPTEKTPITVKQPLARLALIREFGELSRAPVAAVKAHPAAAAFPGAVPDDAPRVTREYTVDTSVPGWHGLGLYAAPGEVVTVVVPEKAAGKLSLRIGAHTDGLWQLDAWRRFPEVSRSFPLARSSNQVASAFGGLIYIEVPQGARLGRVSLTLGPAVEAPRFVLGETSLDDWQAVVRKRPAPWAELATRKVILTVPSVNVRTLDDPEKLMKLWDQVLDAIADLAARPRERETPERIVADVQISAGYMHSGYPIMAHLDAAPRMASYDTMKAGDWGLFHELGHNHQSGHWTFDGTGEVTENLFTLYVYDTVCGVPVGKNRVSGERMGKALADFVRAGSPFAKWQGDPFLALRMYAQLQEAFGWDAFKAVFAGYRDAAPGELPRSDAEKRDQWMVRFSRQVGRNLGPFFQAWGVPTSEKARQSIAGLPEWMPGDMPTR